MKKKILIVLPTLRNGGGVISGLKNMLSLLPTNRFEFHVLPLGYSGSNNVELPNCMVLQNSFILTATDGVYEHSENYRHKFLLWICKVILTLFNIIRLRTRVVNWLYKQVAKKYKDYDVVIGYQEGAATRFSQYIEASNRIAWIHCDYAKYHELHQHQNEESMYSKYNNIVCVSKYTLNNFVSIYPQLKERSTCLYNLLDIDNIQQKSLEICEDISFDKNIINIVSIGRINPVKQFHLIPQIISQILKNGVTNFRWILVGVDLGALEQINQEVKKYDIPEEYFKYIGQKLNPYPYIKNSDLLVSTSSSEACPFVVNEARVLGVPVISNNYPSIYELIKNFANGIICSVDKMPDVLIELITNQKALDRLKQGVQTECFDNYKIVKQICDLFNE